MTKLRNEIRKLQLAAKEGKPIELNHEQLKTCLVEENIVKTVNGKLKINEEIQAICATKPVPIKKKQTLKFLKSTCILPSITGHLLMSTEKGIMTHHKVIEENLGGTLFAVIY